VTTPPANPIDRPTYDSLPIALTRPAHLAAIAHLFDLAAPEVATARVLEIGCASGGNLIPLAASFPEARFVGVDLSAVQVEQGRQRAGAAALANIEFRHASVTEIDASYGAFDYVICHRLYSWVPYEVRRAILRIAAERLSPAGMAIVTYNVMPGWHLKRIARDAMLAHGALFADPAQKLQQARLFLDFLKDRVPPQTPYGQVLRSEAALLASQRDDHVLREFLETENTPCTVTEFFTEAVAAGLGYLADSELHTMLPETHGAQIAGELRRLAANSLLQLEQYIDIVTGRTFRQSILMNPPAMAGAKRALEPSRMAALHVSARFAGLPDLAAAGPFVFTDALGRTLTTGSVPVVRAMMALSARWPQTATADELTDAAAAGSESARDAAQPLVLDAIFRLMTAGMLSVSTVPIRLGAADESHPHGWPLARADALRGAAGTANLRHEPVALDLPSRTLLPLLNGQRDRAALAGAILALVEQGTMSLRKDDKPIVDPTERRDAAEKMVDATIAGLAAMALLI
jgi:SAM-dependent methyltransferase